MSLLRSNQIVFLMEKNYSQFLIFQMHEKCFVKNSENGKHLIIGKKVFFLPQLQTALLGVNLTLENFW